MTSSTARPRITLPDRNDPAGAVAYVLACKAAGSWDDRMYQALYQLQDNYKPLVAALQEAGLLPGT